MANTEQREAQTTTAAEIAPRLTIVLHPNTSRVDIALNDRLFNREKYSFSRKQEAQGAEKALLDMCETCIVGIEGAKASKNTLSLELSDGVLLREFIPQVVTAVIQWGGVIEPYIPQVYVDDRRYAVDPHYDREGMETSRGLRMRPGQADIGLPYKPWDEAALPA